MADFDDAERHAIQEVEPKDQVAWLLEEVDPDLAFFGWLQTQVAPPPGVPQLRCDCVAGLQSRSGTQPPWACLIEAQGQPLAGMAVWMMIYLGLLHNLLRYDGRDPFQMMGVILNLSEGELSHTVLWPVPLRKKPPEATAEGAETGQTGSPPSPVQAPGFSCVFLIKNVRQESAEKTLERIDREELGLCILVWLPLMAGADHPEIVRHWCVLARRQTQLHVRADYVALALVFADMAGRKQLWKTELEGFDVQESSVVREWRMDATLTTARAAVLNVLEARFPGVPVPEGVRSALAKATDARQLTDWLREAAVTASPADFERFLTAADQGRWRE
jgi:hypothetical protein